NRAFSPIWHIPPTQPPSCVHPSLHHFRACAKLCQSAPSNQTGAERTSKWAIRPSCFQIGNPQSAIHSPLLAPLALHLPSKQTLPNSHHRRTSRDGCLEIIAHPHRQMLEVGSPDLLPLHLLKNLARAVEDEFALLLVIRQRRHRHQADQRKA